MAKRNLNKPVRYCNCRIESTPLAKYPEMVTIIRTPKKMNSLENKKFITMAKAKKSIDSLKGEIMIGSGGIKVSKSLMELGTGPEMNF